MGWFVLGETRRTPSFDVRKGFALVLGQQSEKTLRYVCGFEN